MADEHLENDCPDIPEWEEPEYGGHDPEDVVHGIYAQQDCDYREWVQLRDGIRWPHRWRSRRILLHYPPRAGRWYWALHMDVAFGPVGSLVLAPRPQTDEELETFIDSWPQGYPMPGAFDNYQVLQVGLLREDGSLKIHGEAMVTADHGRWFVDFHVPQAFERINKAISRALRDPLNISGSHPSIRGLAGEIHE